MFILKKGHQPGVYVPLRALFLVLYVLCFSRPRYQVSVYRTISPLVFLFVYFFQFKTDKYADLFCILCHISIVSVAKR